MLATPERTRDDHGRTIQLSHLLADGHRCDGECDFHPIACSNDEGIALPAGTRDVPVALDEPGQQWCGACLVIAAQRDWQHTGRIRCADCGALVRTDNVASLPAHRCVERQPAER